MSYESVERLLDRWLNEPAFRAELCRDPERAVRRHGFDLTDEEWAALRRFDWSLVDDDAAADRVAPHARSAAVWDTAPDEWGDR